MKMFLVETLLNLVINFHNVLLENTKAPFPFIIIYSLLSQMIM